VHPEALAQVLVPEQPLPAAAAQEPEQVAAAVAVQELPQAQAPEVAEAEALQEQEQVAAPQQALVPVQAPAREPELAVPRTQAPGQAPV
jgi:hypothetical protein